VVKGNETFLRGGIEPAVAGGVQWSAAGPEGKDEASSLSLYLFIYLSPSRSCSLSVSLPLFSTHLSPLLSSPLLFISSLHFTQFYKTVVYFWNFVVILWYTPAVSLWTIL
jgi:hypothetical protein